MTATTGITVHDFDDTGAALAEEIDFTAWQYATTYGVEKALDILEADAQMYREDGEYEDANYWSRVARAVRVGSN